jgi:uncharacterized membrane protein (DUF373 family)
MSKEKPALRFYAVIERIVVLTLLALLTLIVLWGTGGLAVEIVQRLMARILGGQAVDREWSEALLSQFNIMRDVFGAFLLILIGLELMKTIVMYVDDNVLHVEVVLTVAVIAVARHAIELDLGHVEPMTLVGMGVMILSLALALYFFPRSAGHGPSAPTASGEAHPPAKTD